jgi:restriction endonuclease S subunit
MVKYDRVNLNYLAQESSLRFDFNYLNYSQSKVKNYYNFGELFDLVDSESFLIEDEIKYCEIGNVDNNGLCNPEIVDINNETFETADLVKKIKKNDIQKVFQNNILISKIRPNLKKIVFIDDNLSEVFFTKAFIQLKPKKNPILLYFLLRTRFLDSLISVSRIGKGYPTLHIDDLNSIYFDKNIIDNYLNDKVLLKNLKEILFQIKSTEKKIVKDIYIIDKIINQNLDLPISIIQNKNINQKISLFEISKSDDLRLGYNYNRESHKKTISYFLSKKNFYYFADIIDPNYKARLGQTIISEELKEDFTGYYYISPKSVATSRIIKEDCGNISKEFFDQNKNNFSCNKDDIILRRSGESIGKVAICDFSDNLIVSDFSMLLRIVGYNPKFVYYYLRSSFFQFLIKSNCKTLDLNNIYPSQLEKMMIPKIDKKLQNKICLLIDTDISSNNKILETIEKNEISVIRYLCE